MVMILQAMQLILQWFGIIIYYISRYAYVISELLSESITKLSNIYFYITNF